MSTAQDLYHDSLFLFLSIILYVYISHGWEFWSISTLSGYIRLDSVCKLVLAKSGLFSNLLNSIFLF